MIQRGVAEWARALGLIPSGMFAMTASHGGERTAVLVSWVQQCGFDPPIVAVASPKGRSLAPLIRDSRSFSVCQFRRDDTFLLRTLTRVDIDPYEVLDSIPCETMETGSPCIMRGVAALDCEMIHHIDLDGDHELYIGLVVGGKVYDKDAKPTMSVFASGMVQ